MSSIDRRGFLRIGALAGVLGAAGCGGGEDTTEVKTAPVEGKAGVRNRLGLIKEKADNPPKKKK